MPTASIARRPGAGLRQREKRDRGDQGGPDPAGRRPRAGRQRADGHGHGGDLPDHLRAQAPAVRQTGGALTDARFSGVSTGACIGHVGPEALAGGPIGKVRDGDLVRIDIDRDEGTVDLVGEGERRFTPEEGASVLAARPPRGDLAAALPADTRLWAALQHARRHVGGVRVRRGRDRRGPRAGQEALAKPDA